MKLLIIFAFFLVPNFIQAQNDCNTPTCYGSQLPPCDCQTWSDWNEYIEIMEVSASFPGCTVEVHYCYRQCLDNPKCVELKFNSWHMQNVDCQPCVDYLNWLRSLTDEQQASQTSLFIQNALRRISINHWDEFINGLPSGLWPYCNDEDRHKISWTMESCLGFCYVQNPIDEDQEGIYMYKIPCSEQFCCRNMLTFCIDPLTGNTVMEESYDAYPSMPNCDITVPLTACPPGENIISTSCINTCSIIE